MSVLSVMVPREDEPRTRKPEPASQLDQLDPGVFDATAASFRESKDRVPFVQQARRQRAYLPVIDAVTEINGKSPYWSYFRFRDALNPLDRDPTDYDALWRDIGAIWRSDPERAAKAGLPKPDSRAEFERNALSRQGAHERDAAIAARGGFVPRLAGAAASQIFDPVNVAASIGTGGTSSSVGLARGMLTEGLINAGIEAGETPAYIRASGRLGEDVGPLDVAQNIAGAAAFGAGFHGAVRGGAAAGRAAERALPLDIRLARALGKAEPGPVSDMDLVRAFEQRVPDHLRTPSEQDALHVIRSRAEAEASSPYVNSHAGLSAHFERLDEANARLHGAPVPRRAIRPEGLTVDADRGFAAIVGIEGGTNRDGSFRTSPAGAVGPAQVMPGTAPTAARLAGLPFDEHRYRTDPEYNLALGRAYWREMLRQFDGDAEKAAAAYNAGPGSARSGRGVRGAMARAEKAGVPNDWRSFLPAETRRYIAEFRRRTGMHGGALPEGEAGDALARAADAEAQRLDAETLAASHEEGLPDLPELRRDQFGSEAEWRTAQVRADAERVGVEPGMTGEPTLVGGERPGSQLRREQAISDVNSGQLQGSGQVEVADNGFLGVRASDGSFMETSRRPTRELSGQQFRAELNVADTIARISGVDVERARFLARQHQGFRLSSVSENAAPDARPRGPVTQMPGRRTNKEFLMQGDNARLAGWREADNPYLETSTAWEQWRRGWRQRDKMAPTQPIDGAQPGDAGAGGAFEQTPRGLPAESRTDLAEAEALADHGAYADPAGPALREQAERLSHDLTARAEAEPDRTFRLSEEGGEHTAAQAIEDLDAEDAAIAAIRGCL